MKEVNKITAIERARKAARKAIESTYEGRCTVKCVMTYTDPKTKLTKTKEVEICKDQPCKLSFENLSSANQTETVATIAQGVKLFIAPELNIPAGSTIQITQSGHTADYNRSGQPAVYPTHQEIILALKKEYA